MLRYFPLSFSIFALFVSLEWKIVVVFEAPEPSNVHVWSSRAGLHTTTRELQTCTFQGPGLHKNTTKIQLEDTERETKRAKMGRERKKKERNFGRPAEGGPEEEGLAEGGEQNTTHKTQNTTHTTTQHTQQHNTHTHNNTHNNTHTQHTQQHTPTTHTHNNTHNIKTDWPKTDCQSRSQHLC